METLNILERLTPGERSEIPDAINLMARKGTVEDVAECQVLHESLQLPYAVATWRILPEMWRDMLANGTVQLFLVESRAKPLHSRIVSFNAIVFVTDRTFRGLYQAAVPVMKVRQILNEPKHEI